MAESKRTPLPSRITSKRDRPASTVADETMTVESYKFSPSTQIWKDMGVKAIDALNKVERVLSDVNVSTRAHSELLDKVLRKLGLVGSCLCVLSGSSAYPDCC